MSRAFVSSLLLQLKKWQQKKKKNGKNNWKSGKTEYCQANTTAGHSYS